MLHCSSASPSGSFGPSRIPVQYLLFASAAACDTAEQPWSVGLRPTNPLSGSPSNVPAESATACSNGTLPTDRPVLNGGESGTTTMLDYALAYAARGWHVFPLHTPVDGGCSCGRDGCKSVGKHPRTLRGVKDATLDGHAIRSWWTQWPDANIGIATGSVSKLLVVDIDGEQGEASILAVADEIGDIEISCRVVTGKGHHLYFANPTGGLRNSVGKLGFGVDIRGDGGYVVAPPSLHASGHRYSLEEHDEPLTELPAAWLDRIRKGDTPTSTVNSDGNTGAAIREGQRNSRLTSIAGRFRRDGAIREAILAQLRHENAMHCDPPLDEDELGAIADSVAKYAPANAGSGDDKKPPMSAASRLVEIIETECGADLFASEGTDPIAYMSVNDDEGRLQTMKIDSKACQRWLNREFHHREGRSLSDSSMAEAVRTLEGKAIFDGEQRSLGLRVSGDVSEAIYIDLGDETWRVACVTAVGWTLMESRDCPIRFPRRKAMLPLPVPQSGGSVNELRTLLNVPDDDAWTLLLGWMVMAFQPAGPYPLLAVNGEQGSAKSTLCRAVRSVIDPSSVPLRRPPRDDRDLMIAAGNGWLLGYDNLSGMSAGMSDALCCIATGGGFGTRQLYTDDEETLIEAKRPVIANGIDTIATRSDLLDRAVSLTLPTIDAGDRREESWIEAELERVRPRVFGALLDAVSCALRRRGQVRLDELPRMADLAIWATAAEPVLGLSNGAFMRAYTANRDQASKEAIESSAIGPALLRLLKRHRGSWAGTATELFRDLDRAAMPAERSRKGWPQTPKGVGCAVDRLGPNLRSDGISMSKRWDGKGRSKRRLFIIEGNAPTVEPDAPTSAPIEIASTAA